MNDNLSVNAINSVLNSRRSFCKFLSANDTGATRGHQCGILIALNSWEIMFPDDFPETFIMERNAEIFWPDGQVTCNSFKYYSSKKELRITTFGRGFPYLTPEHTGDLFVLTQQDYDNYHGYFLSTEEDIDHFLDAFSISPTETNRLINTSFLHSSTCIELEIQNYIERLAVEFPSSVSISEAARSIQNRVFNHNEQMISDPDQKLIDWTNMEYTLFRALEQARYSERITAGFNTVEDFISMANMVLNRRKSRAGKSLENHLAALFDANTIRYSAQAVTEGHKKPDFLFPSEMAYHDFNFPVDRIASLAAKTTCKDRWRQIITEADRLRHHRKFLCTLQQGISPAQIDEMRFERVTLVVPTPYIYSYPLNKRPYIWTLTKFINYIKSIEGL